MDIFGNALNKLFDIIEHDGKLIMGFWILFSFISPFFIREYWPQNLALIPAVGISGVLVRIAWRRFLASKLQQKDKVSQKSIASLRRQLNELDSETLERLETSVLFTLTHIDEASLGWGKYKLRGDFITLKTKNILVSQDLVREDALGNFEISREKLEALCETLSIPFK